MVALMESGVEVEEDVNNINISLPNNKAMTAYFD
jgi:hypothetical protein